MTIWSRCKKKGESKVTFADKVTAKYLSNSAYEDIKNYIKGLKNIVIKQETKHKTHCIVCVETKEEAEKVKDDIDNIVCEANAQITSLIPNIESRFLVKPYKIKIVENKRKEPVKINSFYLAYKALYLTGTELKEFVKKHADTEDDIQSLLSKIDDNKNYQVHRHKGCTYRYKQTNVGEIMIIYGSEEAPITIVERTYRRESLFVFGNGYDVIEC